MPIEKTSTLTPQRRATKKWPNSWMNTTAPSTSRNETISVAAPHRLTSIGVIPPSSCASSADRRRRDLAAARLIWA